MVKLRTNKEYATCIQEKLLSKFNDIKVLGVYIDNLPNNNFVIEFQYNDDIISFIKDRGYLGLDLKHNCQYVNFRDIDEKINNLILSVDSIDYYVIFLEKYYMLRK